MGCDIHCMVEYRDVYAGGDGKWHAIEIKNPYRVYHIPDNDGNMVEYDSYIEPYDGRDYQLFGILAGVRSDEYPQMDDARGLPPDVSDEVRAKFDEYSDDYHTPSWYTLNELESWYNNKENFHSVDYKDEAFKPYLRRIKKEDKDMRERFKSFMWGVDFMASLAEYYVAPQNVRVVFWFDN